VTLLLIRYIVRDEEGDTFAYLLSDGLGEAAEPIEPEEGEALIAKGHFREIWNAPGSVLTRYELVEGNRADASRRRQTPRDRAAPRRL
jgi:hypothetical protein